MEYKFYNQLERILGHEVVSIDEYDERDDQTVDQDTGTLAVQTVYLFTLKTQSIKSAEPYL